MILTALDVFLLAVMLLLAVPFVFHFFSSCFKQSFRVDSDEGTQYRFMCGGLVKIWHFAVLIPSLIIGPIIVYYCYSALPKVEENRGYSSIIADDVNSCSGSVISVDVLNGDFDEVKATLDATITTIIVLIVMNILQFPILHWLIPREPEKYGKTAVDDSALNI